MYNMETSPRDLSKATVLVFECPSCFFVVEKIGAEIRARQGRVCVISRVIQTGIYYAQQLLHFRVYASYTGYLVPVPGMYLVPGIRARLISYLMCILYLVLVHNLHSYVHIREFSFIITVAGIPYHTLCW